MPRKLGPVVLGDLVLAFGLLSRLPLPRVALDTTRSAQAAWAWPLVGLVVGGIGAGVAGIALGLGLPAAVAAALCLVAMALATGGLHEDGLADSADGLWGGQSSERRLEIMRDSRVGAYGVLALCLTMLLRFAAITALLEAGQWPVLLAAACLGRTAMIVLMIGLPPARPDGLSKSTGRPGREPVAIALMVTGVTAVLCGLPLIGWLAALALLGWIAWQAQSKLAGQTGDILGAGCLLCETAALIAAI